MVKRYICTSDTFIESLPIARQNSQKVEIKPSVEFPQKDYIFDCKDGKCRCAELPNLIFAETELDKYCFAPYKRDNTVERLCKLITACISGDGSGDGADYPTINKIMGYSSKSSQASRFLKANLPAIEKMVQRLGRSVIVEGTHKKTVKIV